MLNRVTTLLIWIDKLFDFSFRLMKPLPALVVLAVFSVLTAVLSLLVVRWTSNQKAIRRLRHLIDAHVLEVRLFSDQPRVVLRAYLNLLGDTLLYLRYALVSLLVFSLPLLLLFGQLEAHFEHAPLEPGCDFLVSANFQTADSLAGVVLRLPPDLVQTAPSVHVLSEREIDWRIKGQRAGTYDVHVVLQGLDFSKRVVVGTEFASIVPRRLRGSFWQRIISPGEAPLPPGGLVEQIGIQYPQRLFGVGTWKVGWLAPYAALTLAAALLLKGPLRTEI